jgi:hypothetical protein
MKTKSLIVACFGFAAIVILAFVFLILLHQPDNKKNNSVADAASNKTNLSGGNTTPAVGAQVQLGTTKSACTFLTPELAQSLLGTTVNKIDQSTRTSDISTESVVVTNCAYGSSTQNVTLLVRGAKSPGAAADNRAGFANSRVQDIQGGKNATSEEISDVANGNGYFNTSFNQAYVLLGDGTYYIIAQGQDGNTPNKQLTLNFVRALSKNY